MVSLNFNRADLVEIIHIIAQQLRLTYTIDPEVKGTVTINSAEPLRSEDLLPIFHQLLRMNGAVAVRTGNLYHIMPIKDGKGLARPMGQGREDSFALQVIPVRFFSVAEMKRVLTPFLQPGGEIVENPRGNFLIVMDLPSNIQRLIEIAEMIDVQVFAGTRMEIYQPKVASAEELAQEMTKVMQSFASSAPQADSFTAQFVPLPRINQLLVISHSEAAWTYAKRWLDRLDITAEGPGRRIFIYPVENGKATELADVLSQALGHPTTVRRDTTRTLQELHRSTPGGSNPTPGRGTTGMTTGTSGSFGQQSQTFGAYAAVPAPAQVTPPAVPSPTPPPAPAVPRPGTQTPQPQAQQEQLRIVPDPATNSLIIYGTVQEFQNIRNILKELDAVPRQVLLEAMILQVDLNDTESLGVDIEILRRARVTIFGQTFSSRGGLRTLGESLPTAPSFGSGSGLSGIFGGKDIQAIINALMTDSRVKLISSPSVLAADNRPARIQVGSEEPIPTGTINAVVGQPSVSSSTTIQYRNTGRILTILPQVNSKGLVNLQIKAEVSARGDDVPFGTGETFPAFNTQDAETTAIVQDGETLVIGGLIGERKSKTRTGVPYLMDVPVVGRFFGTTTDETRRTELIMLITPHVIRTREESQTVSDEFKSKLGAVRNELERLARERARSKPPLPPPAETLPLPDPRMKEEIPQPSPSRQPPGAGALFAPPYGSNARNIGEALALTAAHTEAIQTRFMPQFGGSEDQSTAEESLVESRDIVVAKPVYALSLGHYKTPVPLASAADVIGGRIAQPKVNRVWAVQVAASAEKKAAESIANTLRQSGYEAYVLTSQVDAKTWHRVRVGQSADIRAANELKKVLTSATPFKQAYVAAN
jgi:general secretion pathway protein D